MVKRKTGLAAALFFVVIFMMLVGELFVEFAESRLLVFIFKPLMMPALAWYMFRALRGKTVTLFHKLIYGALFFSWLGDVFLMDAWEGEYWFLFGLAAFLVAHLLYIPAFRKLPLKHERPLLSLRPYAALPLILYFSGLIYSLYRYGNAEFFEMQYPVILYALVIMIMVLSALNRKNRVGEVSYSLVFLGALLFMFSDSAIAVTKFTGALEGRELLARMFIMSTYAIGQYLIVEGCLRQETDYG